MKRSGFRKNLPSKRDRGAEFDSFTPRPRAIAMSTGAATVGATMPKREPIRSPALVVAYRSIPCQYELDDGRLCLDPRTCCNHSNWACHGKGRGQKADDNRGASGCDYHHRELDQGKNWTADERKWRWWAAHVRTVHALIDCELWPSGVPMPDVDRFPF